MLKLFTVIAFVFMMLVDTLAFIKPLGIRSIAEISDSYPNLLTPPHFTFAIWGLIYLLLLSFVLYQLGILGKNRDKIEKEILHQTRIVFTITSFMNAGWVMAWVFDYMALAVMLVFSILILLKILGKQLRKEYLADREVLFIRLPFSVYYGWITVEAILNLVILMVSIQWTIFGITGDQWMIIIMIILTSIAAFRTIRNRDIMYCLPFIWTYAGILVKHTSADGLNNSYPVVIISVVIGIVILISCIAYLLILKKKRI